MKGSNIIFNTANKALGVISKCRKHRCAKDAVAFLLKSRFKGSWLNDLINGPIYEAAYQQLRSEYLSFATEKARLLQGNTGCPLPQSTVWTCWFQGFENAPEIVQACHASLRRSFPNHNIVALSEQNISDYVEMPDHVVKKYRKGAIQRAQYSDLLRLELLSRDGGIWADATLYFTKCPIPVEMTDSGLFLFAGETLNDLSSWYICSRPGNKAITLTRDLLYKYWMDHDELFDYFQLHMFMRLSFEVLPDEWHQAVTMDRTAPHKMQSHLAADFDEESWAAFCDASPIHKLTYKLSPDAKRNGTFYSHIISLEKTAGAES